MSVHEGDLVRGVYNGRGLATSERIRRPRRHPQITTLDVEGSPPLRFDKRVEGVHSLAGTTVVPLSRVIGNDRKWGGTALAV